MQDDDILSSVLSLFIYIINLSTKYFLQKQTLSVTILH